MGSSKERKKSATNVWRWFEERNLTPLSKINFFFVLIPLKFTFFKFCRIKSKEEKKRNTRNLPLTMIRRTQLACFLETGCLAKKVMRWSPGLRLASSLVPQDGFDLTYRNQSRSVEGWSKLTKASSRSGGTSATTSFGHSSLGLLYSGIQRQKKKATKAVPRSGRP